MTEEQKYIRPSWDEYFMGIAKAAASRATCDRGRSGCCIARDKRILVTGYVGSPMNCPHCDEVGHELHTVRHLDGHETQHCIRTTHAEQNAICQAALLGVSLNGATIYCKMTPCYVCAKMIINCGIKRVVCEFDYHDGERSKEIFSQAGVEYCLLNNQTVQYENM
ncbi:MAG: cytidine/deoxycytidylate deaminase family protein [Patescibacteria group bacterium]